MFDSSSILTAERSTDAIVCTFSVLTFDLFASMCIKPLFRSEAVVKIMFCVLKVELSSLMNVLCFRCFVSKVISPHG